jgi:predicted outer membrane repeat protein
MYTAKNSSLVGSDCQFVNNTAGYGGALHMNDSTLTLNESQFGENRAASAFGGAVILSHVTSEMYLCEFISNMAATLGGAMIALQATLRIRGTHFLDNSAKSGGGLCCLEKSVLTIISSQFDQNMAQSGGVLHGNGSKFAASGSRFINNSAAQGGAVYTDLETTVTMNSCGTTLTYCTPKY